MKKIEAIIRPEALLPLQQALVAAGLPGMSASDVRGLGRQDTQVQCAMRTGRIGDGKVFTRTLDTALRIRTAEKGLMAI